MKKETVLLIGTVKGLFIAFSDSSRNDWELSGPHFAGNQIYAVAFDQNKNRIWASSHNPFYGTELFNTNDFGLSWTKPQNPLIQFPNGENDALKNIWQIQPSKHDHNTVFCGVEPACLFVSNDCGESFRPVDGFYRHPHRAEWMPGAGGLCLHTIIEDHRDAKVLWTAVSTGGVYKTVDGGITWEPKNKGIKASFLPDPEAAYGQCVHKMVQHPHDSETLYLQHHWGVYQSDDGGETWYDIGQGLPSDFGFALAIAPVPPYSLFLVPLKSDEFRCCPDGKLAVYRRAGDKAWECLDEGLPSENSYETILRDALAVDSWAETGVYFGTRNGKIWASALSGGNWRLLYDSLPSVLTVKAYVIN